MLSSCDIERGLDLGCSMFDVGNVLRDGARGLETDVVKSVALCANRYDELKFGRDDTWRREVVVVAHVDVLGGGESGGVDVRRLEATRWHQRWCRLQPIQRQSSSYHEEEIGAFHLGVLRRWRDPTA